MVSWCVGHLLEQAMPEDYDKRLRHWRREDLPIFPQPWKLLPKAATRDQLQAIRGLLKEADLVINCGDPDREGQLLVDEVLEHLRWRGRTLRAWQHLAPMAAICGHRDLDSEHQRLKACPSFDVRAFYLERQLAG